MLWDPTLTAAGPFQSPRASPQQLEDLRAYLKKAEQFGQSTKEMVPVVPFGIAEIDRHLPTGGLVQDALHELFAENHADIGAVTVFCITILIRLLSIEDQNPKRPPASKSVEKNKKCKNAKTCKQMQKHAKTY